MSRWVSLFLSSCLIPSEGWSEALTLREQIAIFASVDLITREWALGDPDVRISSTWKVFEISSGELDDSGNYGACAGLRVFDVGL